MGARLRRPRIRVPAPRHPPHRRRRPTQPHLPRHLARPRRRPRDLQRPAGPQPRNQRRIIRHTHRPPAPRRLDPRRHCPTHQLGLLLPHRPPHARHLQRQLIQPPLSTPTPGGLPLHAFQTQPTPSPHPSETLSAAPPHHATRIPQTTSNLTRPHQITTTTPHPHLNRTHPPNHHPTPPPGLPAPPQPATTSIHMHHPNPPQRQPRSQTQC